MSKNSTTNPNTGIPTEIDEKLEFQALAEDTAASGLIIDFLRKYASWDQFIGDIDFVFLQELFVQNIFKRYLDKVLVKVAKPSYYTGVRDMISFIHGRNDFRNIVGAKLWFSAFLFTNKVIRSDLKVELVMLKNYMSLFLKKKKTHYLMFANYGTPVTKVYCQLSR